MKNYAFFSYWLETCGDDLTPRPPLERIDRRRRGDPRRRIFGAVDRLLPAARQPSLKIALRRDGDRGLRRLGAQRLLVHRAFPDQPRRAGEALWAGTRDRALPGHGRRGRRGRAVAAAEGLDIQFAQGRRHVGRARAAAIAGGSRRARRIRSARARRPGRSLLDKAQTDARVKIAGVLGAIYYKDAATIHPGRLVRGLARAVERRGCDDLRADRGDRFHHWRPSDAAYRARRRARQDDRALRRGLSHAACAAAPAIDPGLFADDADRTARRRPIGQRSAGSERECIDSCRLTIEYIGEDGRRPHSVRRARRALSFRLRDRGRVRPARADHADVPGQRADMVSAAEGRPVHACLGRPARSAARLHADHDVRPGARVASARGYVGNGVATTNLVRPRAGRSDLRREIRDHRRCRASTTARPTGSRSRSATRRALSSRATTGRSTRRRNAPACAPSGKTLAERLTRH